MPGSTDIETGVPVVLYLTTGETVRLSASSDTDHDALETLKKRFDEGLQSLKAA